MFRFLITFNKLLVNSLGAPITLKYGEYCFFLLNPYMYFIFRLPELASTRKTEPVLLTPGPKGNGSNASPL